MGFQIINKISELDFIHVWNFTMKNIWTNQWILMNVLIRGKKTSGFALKLEWKNQFGITDTFMNYLNWCRKKNKMFGIRSELQILISKYYCEMIVKKHDNCSVVKAD